MFSIKSYLKSRMKLRQTENQTMIYTNQSCNFGNHYCNWRNATWLKHIHKMQYEKRTISYCILPL